MWYDESGDVSGDSFWGEPCELVLCQPYFESGDVSSDSFGFGW